MTLFVRVALNSKYLFVVGAKPFSANKKGKYKYYYCAFQIFYICSVVYGPICKQYHICITLQPLIKKLCIIIPRQWSYIGFLAYD